MTMDLDIVMVIFYQRFLWRFQKHITLGVFIVFWKNRNLKQESHLNLHCWSIWYFLNPPPPVLFTLNERNYFTTTSWHKFFLSKFNDAILPTSTILVLSTYSPFCWIVALVTILPRQIISVPGVSHPSLITYHFPLISSCHHTLLIWTAHLARKETAHLARNDPETIDISLKRQDDIPCYFFGTLL